MNRKITDDQMIDKYNNDFLNASNLRLLCYGESISNAFY